MKKTYFKPQINVVAIQTRSIICTSGLGFANQGTEEGGVTSADSREFEWDDEDEY
jgi:hypothetical protein